MKAVAMVSMLLALSLPLAGAAGAAKKEKRVDRIWIHPEIESLGVGRIAMLPVITFNSDLPNEKLVENHVSQALRETGYRWISATTTREVMRQVSAGTDSLLKVVKKSVLDTGRPDSLLTPSLCALLRADAILAIRIDQWEQTEIESDQSGKPSTSIQLRAALVDSSGALLWSASGSQTGEGPYHEANAGTIGVSGGALSRTVITGQGGAPSFAEVLTPLLARWKPQFPAKPVPAPAPAPAPESKTP